MLTLHTSELLHSLRWTRFGVLFHFCLSEIELCISTFLQILCVSIGFLLIKPTEKRTIFRLQFSGKGDGIISFFFHAHKQAFDSLSEYTKYIYLYFAYLQRVVAAATAADTIYCLIHIQHEHTYRMYTIRNIPSTRVFIILKFIKFL